MSISFDMIGIVVADMPASLAFYRRLGLDIPAGVDHEPHVEVTLPNGLRLAWDPVSTIESFDPGWEKPSGGARVALAFKCDTPAEVDAVWTDLTGAGYHSHLDPFDAFWGQRYATVHDPDGNSIDLFCALPDSA